MLAIFVGVSIVIFLVSLFFRLKGSPDPVTPTPAKTAEAAAAASAAEPVPAPVVYPRPTLVLYHIPFVVKLAIFLLLSVIGYLLYCHGVPIHQFGK
jgi:hypothetical protein